MIFSVFGGIQYNVLELNKNTILKLAHSLSEKGVMFIGVNTFFDSGLPRDQIVKNITKTLNKNGFDLKYSYISHNIYYRLPMFMFRIERL